MKDDEKQAAWTRREFVGIAVAGTATAIALPPGSDRQNVEHSQVSLTINGSKVDLEIDARTTLLDLFRENLHLVGAKKGCDHGQCGACTVLVNGTRVNSCLTLAVMKDGCEVTTIEGLTSAPGLHPMQRAFIENDGLQCGYCTPGQICSAVAMLEEAKAGAPSAVTRDIAQIQPINLTDDEIRERMSGNLCRCGAYVGILAAIRSVETGRTA